MCRLYVLVEPTPHGPVVRYIGKATQNLNSRCGQHKRRARTDGFNTGSQVGSGVIEAARRRWVSWLFYVGNLFRVVVCVGVYGIITTSTDSGCQVARQYMGLRGQARAKPR